MGHYTGSTIHAKTEKSNPQQIKHWMMKLKRKKTTQEFKIKCSN
jgi:hypothetical protein